MKFNRNRAINKLENECYKIHKAHSIAPIVRAKHLLNILREKIQIDVIILGMGGYVFRCSNKKMFVKYDDEDPITEISCSEWINYQRDSVIPVDWKYKHTQSLFELIEILDFLNEEIDIGIEDIK